MNFHAPVHSVLDQELSRASVQSSPKHSLALQAWGRWQLLSTTLQIPKHTGSEGEQRVAKTEDLPGANPSHEDHESLVFKLPTHAPTFHQNSLTKYQFNDNITKSFKTATAGIKHQVWTSLIAPVVKNLTGRYKRHGSGPWVGEDLLQEGHVTPIFLPRESHGQRSLTRYSQKVINSWTQLSTNIEFRVF